MQPVYQERIVRLQQTLTKTTWRVKIQCPPNQHRKLKLSQLYRLLLLPRIRGQLMLLRPLVEITHSQGLMVERVIILDKRSTSALLFLFQEKELKSFGYLRPSGSVSYTHLRAHETPEHLVCRLLLE